MEGCGRFHGVAMWRRQPEDLKRPQRMVHVDAPSWPRAYAIARFTYDYTLLILLRPKDSDQKMLAHIGIILALSIFSIAIALRQRSPGVEFGDF